MSNCGLCSPRFRDIGPRRKSKSLTLVPDSKSNRGILFEFRCQTYHAKICDISLDFSENYPTFSRHVTITRATNDTRTGQQTTDRQKTTYDHKPNMRDDRSTCFIRAQDTLVYYF